MPENDVQAEAFAVVRAALAKSKKAGLGKIAFGGREHILAITAAPGDEAGMMAYTMRYQEEELRKPAEYFSDIKKVKIDEDSLELAETLIKKRTAKFDPSKFVDGYEAALVGTGRSQGQASAHPAGRGSRRPHAARSST